MAGLTSNGYTYYTAEELKQELINQNKLRNPEFQEQDADIQNNFLDTAIVGLMQFEKMLAILLNAYSPSYATDSIFLQFAESLGLRKKSSFKSQVSLTFKGKFGEIIPSNTIVTNTNGDIEWVTQEYAVVGTTGEVNVLALSDATEVAQANTLTKLKTIISSTLEVTNRSQSLEYVEAETTEELIRRAQAKLRGARVGGKLYADSLVKSVEGVNSRLVAFYDLTYEDKTEQTTYWYKGVEAIVGGGADEEVALALYKGFVETQHLLSRPSNDENNRKITQTLYVLDSPVQIQFTRPKNIPLYLELNIAFTSGISTPTAISDMLKNHIEEFINSNRVGVPINETKLNSLILPVLELNGIYPYIIKSIRWRYKIAQVDNYEDFNADGFISAIEKDCYPTLKEFGVNLNA